MITLFEFSQAISKLNKEGKFNDALKYFKENKSKFTHEQIVSNNYLISAMLTALRKTENFNHAFKFLDTYGISIDENTEESILIAYGWLLYSKFKAENYLNNDHQIGKETFDDEEAITTIDHYYTRNDTITKIVSFLPLILKVNTDYAYFVVSKLFNSVIKTEKKKPNANWKLVNEICNLISPGQLHTDCKTIEVNIKGRRKQMEFASDKENWFAYKSKALIKLKMFQECYEISKSALGMFPKFHYSNDVWFARRIALSKKQLGDLENAISELQQILEKKREWFIQKELSELYKEKGDIDNAFNLAVEAINNFGDIEYKVDLLFLLGEILKVKGQDDLAFKHFSLSRLIRIDEEWKIPDKLLSVLRQFEKENIHIEELQDLKNELKKYWNSFNSQQSNTKQEEDQRLSGKIDKILHDNEKGIDGFIKYGCNKSIYFTIKSEEDLKIGTSVSFKIKTGTKGKRDYVSKVTKLK